MRCSAVASRVMFKKRRKKKKSKRTQKQKKKKEKRKKPLRGRGVVQCVAVLQLGVQRLSAPCLLCVHGFFMVLSFSSKQIT
jgi:polyferredoxin